MAKELFEYRNVGTHPEDLHDGRIVEVGGFVELTKEELRVPHNERLVAEKVLIPTGEEEEHEAQLAERREKRKVGES